MNPSNPLPIPGLEAVLRGLIEGGQPNAAIAKLPLASPITKPEMAEQNLTPFLLSLSQALSPQKPPPPIL